MGVEGAWTSELGDDGPAAGGCASGCLSGASRGWVGAIQFAQRLNLLMRSNEPSDRTLRGKPGVPLESGGSCGDPSADPAGVTGPDSEASDTQSEPRELEDAMKLSCNMGACPEHRRSCMRPCIGKEGTERRVRHVLHVYRADTLPELSLQGQNKRRPATKTGEILAHVQTKSRWAGLGEPGAYHSNAMRQGRRETLQAPLDYLHRAPLRLRAAARA